MFNKGSGSLSTRSISTDLPSTRRKACLYQFLFRTNAIASEYTASGNCHPFWKALVLPVLRKSHDLKKSAKYVVSSDDHLGSLGQ